PRNSAVRLISVLRNFGAITGTEFLEDKRFKKPGGMGKVPFCRAHVGHRLNDTVFRLETREETVGEVSDLMKTGKKALNTACARMKIPSFGRDRVGGGFR